MLLSNRDLEERNLPDEVKNQKLMDLQENRKVLHNSRKKSNIWNHLYHHPVLSGWGSHVSRVLRGPHTDTRGVQIVNSRGWYIMSSLAPRLGIKRWWTVKIYSLLIRILPRSTPHLHNIRNLNQTKTGIRVNYEIYLDEFRAINIGQRERFILTGHDGDYYRFDTILLIARIRNSFHLIARFVARATTVILKDQSWYCQPSTYSKVKCFSS